MMSPELPGITRRNYQELPGSDAVRGLFSTGRERLGEERLNFFKRGGVFVLKDKYRVGLFIMDPSGDFLLAPHGVDGYDIVGEGEIDPHASPCYHVCLWS